MLLASAIRPRMVPTTAPARGPEAGRGGGEATRADTTAPPAAGGGPGTSTAVPPSPPGNRTVSTPPPPPPTQPAPPPPTPGGMTGMMGPPSGVTTMLPPPSPFGGLVVGSGMVIISGLKGKKERGHCEVSLASGIVYLLTAWKISLISLPRYVIDRMLKNKN